MTVTRRAVAAGGALAAGLVGLAASAPAADAWTPPGWSSITCTTISQGYIEELWGITSLQFAPIVTCRMNK
jgi:hypothetical protein